MNLNELSLPELKQLERDVAKAIRTYEQRTKSAALAELEEVAKRHGMKLSDVLNVKAARGSVPPKYRHPENPELTWTGRGRKPKWVAEALDAGGNLDDLAI